jgi:hypothetical protein
VRGEDRAGGGAELIGVVVPNKETDHARANVVGRAIRGLEVGTGYAASTAFQISEAVLFLTRRSPSLN